MATRVIPATTAIVALEDVMLDQLCFEHALSALRDRALAGKVRGYIEATMVANPGIAESGAVLPLGLKVILPEFIIDTETTIVRLWD